MLFFFPAYGTNPRTMTQTPWIESIQESKSCCHQTPFEIILFFKKAERNERVKSDARKKRGDGMETLSSVACKLYEYWYFAIVFRLSVEERNWASSSSLIIAHFIFFVYSRVFLQNRSIPAGWKRRGLHFENEDYQEDRYPANLT